MNDQKTKPEAGKSPQEMLVIVFLDIDGVLNSNDFVESSRFDKHGEYPDQHLDTLAIERVNKLCKSTGAKIVISSTWRSNPEVFDVLKRNGLTAEIIGVTPHSDKKLPNGLWTREIRGKEIQQWIDKNRPDRYCIIDDDTDMLPEQKPHFVNTDFMHGITNKDMQKAISILSQ